MKNIWTRHAEQRQQEWERKRGITRFEVERVVLNPGQVVQGDLNVVVAQAKRDDGLLRIPCISTTTGVKILTVYWTSKVDKYWEENQ